ncbi:MAG: helix-turn-helix domain-containing protein, partial [Bacillota bacterium]|nr:helix-turn-helix domain-containing protein [Bacillota bacterium]
SWKERIKNIETGLNSMYVPQNAMPILIVSCGKRVNEVNRVHESYYTAKEALFVSQRLGLTEARYDELGLDYYLSVFAEESRMAKIKIFSSEKLKPLLDFDDIYDGKLLNTLREFYACYGNKKSTAENLHIYRQSLYSRLEQIEDLMKMDVTEKNNRLTLEIALLVLEHLP